MKIARRLDARKNPFHNFYFTIKNKNCYIINKMEKDLFKKRWTRALRVAKFLQLAPFLEMIGVNGSMTLGNIKESSDIDFLIVSKPGRIWTCRFFVTFLTHLTGKRRYNKKIAGRICLNRYHTDDFLEIFPHDSYHGKVFSKLFPILDLGDFYKKYKEINEWLNEYGFQNFNYPKVKPSKTLGIIRKTFEKLLSGQFGNWLEQKLGDWQKKRIQNDIRTITAPKGRVRVSDKELCFHPLKDSELK